MTFKTYFQNLPKKLQWYGHVQRVEERTLPKEVMEWSPLGRRKLGRPKLTWAEGIRGLKWSPEGRRKLGRPKLTWAEGIRVLMGEKGLMEKSGMTETNGIKR